MKLTQEQIEFINNVLSEIPENWDNIYDIYIYVKDICLDNILFYVEEDDGMYEIYSGLIGDYIFDYLQEP